jgi:hypothetical protein
MLRNGRRFTTRLSRTVKFLPRSQLHRGRPMAGVQAVAHGDLAVAEDPADLVDLVDIGEVRT